MLESAQAAINYAADGRAAFNTDARTQDAIIRRLEIIGEASNQLSREFKQAHPQIAWQKIYTMRNALIHAYNRVDLSRVWNTVQDDLPALLRELEMLLQE
jgi:uncharacterized protein with HEPN domain